MTPKAYESAGSGRAEGARPQGSAERGGADAPLRIGTRGSDLALRQARRIAALIEARLYRATEIVVIETVGDRDRTAPVEELGEVGVFTKELERSLLAGEIDLAVHSLKDLPTLQPEGLVVAAIPERGDARDVLVSRAPLDQLAPGARVGTSSWRRRAQLEAIRPDLFAEAIRGNVPTRIEKCRRGEYDAVILAAAGLDRLELRLPSDLRRFDLPLETFLPAPGQGALAIETRAADAALYASIDRLDERECIEAERTLLRLIDGGCSIPLGAYAVQLDGGGLELRAMLGQGRTPRRAIVRAATAAAAAELALRVIRPDPTALAPGLEGETRAEVVPVTPRPYLRRCRWTLVTSPAAAALLRGAALDRVAAIGPETAEALARAGIPVDMVARDATAGGLAEALLAAGVPKRTSVLLPGSRHERPELAERLTAAGYDVHAVATHETRPLGAGAGAAGEAGSWKA